MVNASSWTLSEASRVLGEPQHRLIHLCEKGTIRPEIEEARGRGSSRRFSRRNMLEFSIALKLRELMIPVSAVTAVLHVLRTTERAIARDLPGFVLPDSLTERGAPELRVIITDDRRIFFALHAKGRAPRLLGGIDLKADGDGRSRGVRKNPPKLGLNTPEPTFTPRDVHERGRVEVSVTGLARDLSRTLKEK
jgi:DNA-binding transcriptional MerR regulator